LPLFQTVFVWPEIVVPAYFISKGAILYRDVFFAHTPLFILLVSAAGRVLGWNGGLFRAIACFSLLMSGVAIAAGSRGRAPWVPVLGLIFLICWAPTFGIFAVWPDVVLGALALTAGLLLERDETFHRAGTFVGAAAVLGTAILIKQTAAWLAIGPLVRFVIRREKKTRIATFLAIVAIPYALFGLGWWLVFRTTSHIAWTLIDPLFSSVAADTRKAFPPSEIVPALAPFLFLAAATFWRRIAGESPLSPVGWIALSAVGMAWPRSDLLHLTAALPSLALLGARSAEDAMAGRAGPGVPGEKLLRFGGWATSGVSAVLALASMLVLLKGPWSGPLYFWDDPSTAGIAREVRKRVPPGGRVFLFDLQGADNVYVIDSVLTPDSRYVNTNFWYYLRRHDVDRKTVSALRGFRGWILYREPGAGEIEIRATELYRFLTHGTMKIGPAPFGLAWRRHRAGSPVESRAPQRFSTP